VLAFLYVPLVTMILLSLNASSFAAFPMTGVTTHWYAAILDAGAYRSAFATSLLVAVIVTALALAVGVPAAFALMRRRFLVRPLLSGALVASLGLPGIVIGFAIFALLIEAGLEPSLLSVVIGQLVVLVPFVVLSLGARLQRMDRSLEEAARDLGCTPREVLRRVTLPLVAPVLVGGGLLVFALSMDEFVVTHFTIGDQETFPVLIWAQLHRRGLDPSVNAAATLLVVTTLLAFLAAGLVTRSRRGAGVARDLSAAAGGEAR
jgi:spermidine/putrescine transport system permease protein